MIEALTVVSGLVLAIAAFIFWLNGGPEYRIVKNTNGYGKAHYHVEQKVLRFIYSKVLRGTLDECREYILRESVKSEVVK